jgi:chromosome segregation ATPase
MDVEFVLSKHEHDIDKLNEQNNILITKIELLINSSKDLKEEIDECLTLIHTNEAANRENEKKLWSIDQFMEKLSNIESEIKSLNEDIKNIKDSEAKSKLFAEKYTNIFNFISHKLPGLLAAITAMMIFLGYERHETQKMQDNAYKMQDLSKIINQKKI